jgi:GNAT superfamily N-acetyltransferase
MKISDITIQYKIVPLKALKEKISVLRKLSYADGEMWRLLDMVEHDAVQGNACLAMSGNSIIGWASKVKQGDGKSELQVYVKRMYRRQGIGRRLVNKLYPQGLKNAWYNPHDKTSDAFYTAIDN